MLHAAASRGTRRWDRSDGPGADAGPVLPQKQIAVGFAEARVWCRAMTSPLSRVALDGPVPIVEFPRRYNAAVDLVERHLGAGRDRIAIRDDGGATSFGELAARVNRAGNVLRELGVDVEQRVLLVMHDSVDFPAVFLGAMRIGAVPVPVNTMLRAGDVAHMIRDSRARVIVVSDALRATVEEAVAIAGAAPRLLGTGELAERAARAPAELAAADTTPDDVAFWLYSSGSTGAPKGAIHLHSHLVQTAALYGQGVLGMGADDVVFSAAKLFFAYGLGNALTFPLFTGATAVLTAQRPTPAVVEQIMRDHAPTLFFGVPTLFASLLASPTFAVSPALRRSASAGEALPRHVGEAWRARFGTDILDGIGSTEMLHIFLSNRLGDVHYGTSGRPVPGYQLRLLDDDGAPVADGVEGALWVRGPSACAGYWNQRARTLATFHGDWTRTGDSYVRNPDGTYTFAGRSDDMLKVGGIWVSPFEVESALAAHPAVLEVAVVGSADGDGLIKPRAFVVLKDAAAASAELDAELKAFVKDRLAPYKYPRWIQFQAELPKTATGKIQRFKLRA
jgi:benzoate-CoA ligase family protein